MVRELSISVEHLPKLQKKSNVFKTVHCERQYMCGIDAVGCIVMTLQFVYSRPEKCQNIWQAVIVCNG